jgi:2-phospho-L-lactate guanylyltransferase
MPDSMTTLAILPVKRLAAAKVRLGSAVPAEFRRMLAEAMYADVLTALRRTKLIDGILVVTADKAAALVAEGQGAEVIEDTGESHSDAAVIGLAHAQTRGAARALLVPLDCPLLDPVELDALLARPSVPNSAVIVPDRHGEGTNALLLTPPTALTPAFGEGSRGRHVALATAQGSTADVVEVPTLALDIDTPQDMEELRQQFAIVRGRAAHTRGMLVQIDRMLA